MTASNHCDSGGCRSTNNFVAYIYGSLECVFSSF